ncbi:carbohydrate-binding wsc [Trichoderma arundinaceum]|uniref:Carbohydrate-binding wsc n=1 Tax=Trichoderma arundinaceum TaxID=490622 RepID=A0A395NGR0_TRIAR|nr:carbohydrate-binding wsc [Trichoderma arundinaceum]
MGHPIALLLRLLLFIPLIYAANATVSVYDDSDKYKYYGCYNETTQVPGSAETRALGGGIDESLPGEMTVPKCLAYCGNGATEYRYAGLEWSRECWCAQTLSGIAEKLDDSACNYPCEGDNTTACGGSLKLTVYRVSSASGLSISSFLSLLTIGLVTIMVW